MKKRNKIILIIFIVIASIVLLCCIFAIIDYKRAKDGKKPKFIYTSYNFESFDVEIAGEENIEKTKSLTYTVYHGLGYNIAVCNICKKTVSFMPFGIGTYPFSTLTCTEESAINDKHTMEYTFMDGKLDTISETYIIPSKDISDVDSYKNEFNKINDIKGCGGDFTEKMDTHGKVSYTTNQSCDLSKMSDDNIKKIYSSNRGSITQTKNEIIDEYKKNNPDMKCEDKIGK